MTETQRKKIIDPGAIGIWAFAPIISSQWSTALESNPVGGNPNEPDTRSRAVPVHLTPVDVRRYAFLNPESADDVAIIVRMRRSFYAVTSVLTALFGFIIMDTVPWFFESRIFAFLAFVFIPSFVLTIVSYVRDSIFENSDRNNAGKRGVPHKPSRPWWSRACPSVYDWIPVVVAIPFLVAVIDPAVLPWAK
ncbi:hypothetical protein [Haloglycomyces albus]|uniref:hypothetical protein n=1 Tax=Haloglycomyces albus TaxID=526067 RepID=UPI00046CA842|nr:hypothetical protein [Haloglycomyces albus]